MLTVINLTAKQDKDKDEEKSGVDEKDAEVMEEDEEET